MVSKIQFDQKIAEKETEKRISEIEGKVLLKFRYYNFCKYIILINMIKYGF